MKKSILVLAALLALSFAGCAGTPASGSSAQEVNSSPDPEVQLAFDAADGTVSLHVEFAQISYDLDSPIAATVVIENIGDHSISYVKGSGSNIAPEALQIHLGELADIFHPLAMTMDYQIEELEPGQKLELVLEFVPYVALSEGVMAGPGTEMEFFRDSEDFAPADIGTVEGSAVFTYFPTPENSGDSPIIFPPFQQEAEENPSVSVEFFTTILYE